MIVSLSHAEANPKVKRRDDRGQERVRCKKRNRLTVNAIPVDLAPAYPFEHL